MKWLENALKWAAIGLGVGLVLSFFVGCESIGACAEEWIGAFFGCGDASCSAGCQEFTGNPLVKNCIVYSVLLCSIGGGIYGYFQDLQDKKYDMQRIAEGYEEEQRRQRAAWASELKQSALNISSTCSRNLSSNKSLVNTTYKADGQMTEILNELTKVGEQQGIIESIAKELN